MRCRLIREIGVVFLLALLPQFAAVSTGNGIDRSDASVFSSMQVDPAEENENWWTGFGGPASLPGLNGRVQAMVVYNGSLVVSGSYTLAGEAEADGIASWDGARWHSIAGEMDGGIYALAVHEGSLIAVGSFNRIGDTPVRNIASWNGSTWRALGAGIDGPAYAVTVYRGDLIVGGSFSSAGGVPASNIARWDGTTWWPLGEGTSTEGSPQIVAALTQYGDQLIAGGAFDIAGQVFANDVASWDGVAWNRLGDGPGNSDIHCLIEHAGGLFAGGTITYGLGGTVPSITRWDGTSWTPLQTGEDTFQALSFAVFRGHLVVGGFDWSHMEAHVRQWDGATWQSMATILGYDDLRRVEVMVPFGDDLFVGGEFTEAGGVPASNIARWDGGDWRPVYEPRITGNGFDDGVSALFQDGRTLFAGGRFKNAGGAPARMAASWDGQAWTPLGAELTPDNRYSSDPGVRAFASYSGHLFAGGDFTIEGAATKANLAWWDGTRWVPVGDGFGEGYYSEVNSLTVYRGELIAGGYFLLGDEHSSIANIARWNGTEWAALGEGFGGRVNSVATFGDTLVAAGEFDMSGETWTGPIARWDGTAWASMHGERWPAVQSLLVNHGVLYACTWGSLQVPSEVARWDGDRWTVLGQARGGEITALAVHEGLLVATGRFSGIDNVVAKNIAAWDGTQWHRLGSGLSGLQIGRACLLSAGGDLVVGGRFTTAGEIPSANIAFWSDRTKGCVFEETAVGDSVSRSARINNQSGEEIRVSGIDLPRAPFSFSSAFLRDLENGITIPPDSFMQVPVQFAPRDSGDFGQQVTFLCGPRNVRSRLFLHGSARNIRLSWKSSDLYRPERILAPGESIFVQVANVGGIPVNAVTLWAGEGGAADLTPVQMDYVGRGVEGDLYEQFVPGSWAGPRGVQFYMTAQRGTAVQRYPASGGRISRRTRIENLAVPSGSPANTYSMISLPVHQENNAVLAVLDDDLGPVDPVRWRLFGYDPGRANYFALPNDSLYAIEQGRAYWLITRDQVGLDTGPPPSVSTPTDVPFSVPLSPGWNMIGNPFAFDVAWDSILVQTGTARPVNMNPTLIEPPYTWDQSIQGYRDSIRVLYPFKGYWVRNRTQGEVTLLIPPIEETKEDREGAKSNSSGDRRGRRTDAAAGPDREAEWTIRIEAVSGLMHDGSNYAATRFGAADGADAHDRSEPPTPPGKALSLFFLPDCEGDKHERLSTDARDVFATGGARLREWTFHVSLSSQPDAGLERISLRFDGIRSLPDSTEMVLVDRRLDRRIDLRAASEYSFLTSPGDPPTTAAGCRFVLLVGAGASQDGNALVRLPNRTDLGLILPNPAKGGVLVSYEVANPVKMQIEVFNIHGARVKTLQAGVQPPGRYELFWDRSDEGNRPVASGVYFVRLSGDRLVRARKVTILR